MEVVFTDVVQVSQVGASVAACLCGADGVQAGVATQLGEAGPTVAGPDALRARAATWSFEGTTSLFFATSEERTTVSQVKM